uniref:Uncharacterized protein n=1 Tax=Acrobeloides nanus TaxID=290746 RepID=A0A914D074_9BILA
MDGPKEEQLPPKIAKQESFTIPYEADEFDEKYLDIEEGIKGDPSANDSKPDKKSNMSSLKYSAPPLPEKKLPRKNTGMPKKRGSSIWERFSTNKFAHRSLRR